VDWKEDTYDGERTMTTYTDPPRCQWCGNFHTAFCPRVKAIEYQPGGVFIQRVEFFAPNDYPQPKIDNVYRNTWESGYPFTNTNKT
jgi:hypothetical protein